MAHIFISYRRQDTQQIATRIHDQLSIKFGPDNVFLDLVKLPRHKGEDFRQRITAEIESCSVFLAIIGKRWLTLKDEDGLRRIDKADDPVRQEIELALSLYTSGRNLPLVIPVLINKITMPKDRHLPESLRDLAFKQAAFIRDDPQDFYRDMKELMEGIPLPTPEAPMPLPEPPSEQWSVDTQPITISTVEVADRHAEQLAAPINRLLPPAWLLALTVLGMAALSLFVVWRDLTAPPAPVITAAPTVDTIATLLNGLLTSQPSPVDTPLPAGTGTPTAFEWIPEQPLLIRNAQTSWLRTRPDSDAPVITSFTDNTILIVVEGPIFDGVQWWWKLRTLDSRFRGWLEQYQLREYIPRPEEVMLVTATASPEASPTP